MSKRRKNNSWHRSIKKRLAGKRQDAARHARLNGFEQLEERQMLTVDAVHTEIISPQAAATKLVDAAFHRAADLSTYSATELQNAARWVVVTDGTITPNNFTTKTGMIRGGTFDPIANTYFALSDGNSSGDIIGNLQATAGIKYFYPEVGSNFEKLSLPNDTFVRDQWHLRNTGQKTSTASEANFYGEWGADIRVEDAWEISRGEGTVIAIVDDSLFYVHPDLADNYDPSLSFDYTEGDTNPAPNTTEDFHGTAVGGLAGAVGNNGTGVTGVAYEATLAGIRLIGYDPVGVTSTEEKFYNALTHKLNDIDIYNSSFGLSNGRAITEIGPFETQALIDAMFLGRNGTGTILVNASGNSADIDDRTDHDSFASSMYTIAVSGFGPSGTSVGYAEAGSSIFVSAPTGNNPPGIGLTTTDVYGAGPSGDVGYNDGNTVGEYDDDRYTGMFNGTSAASPVAAGVVGLMVGAARDNGVELTPRDIKHILALSARRIDATDLGGWQADARPLFFDPPEAMGIPFGAAAPMGPGVTAFPTMIDPLSGAIVPDLVAQFANATNSAGYFIHDTTTTGYGHGAIDAAAAVELASTWESVGSQHSTIVAGASFIPGLIPSSQTIDPGIVIPGAYGGFVGREFAEYFDLWLNPPDTLPDPLPQNGRGAPIPIIVPANMTIEDIQITLDIDIAPEDSDKLRMTLISPDGTHSELTNWIQDGSIGPLTDTGNFNHTFTTVRHWGERSEGVGRINPLTGDRIEPNVLLGLNGEVTDGVWQLVFENWSGSDATLNGGSINFHGVPTPVVNNFGSDLGGRIQGSIGLDTNQDGLFNVIGTTTALGMPVPSMVNGIPFVDQPVISVLDAAFEPMVAGVTVYVDIDKDGVRDATEPSMLTGADGNYYFDLAYNQPGTSYDIRFEMPAGYTNLGPDMLQYIIGVQSTGDVQSTHMDAFFLLEPEAITFEGNVFADLDADAVQDFGETAVEEFRVFVDLNENGKLDFTDVNANQVFDNGIDIAQEPMAITEADGTFSIDVTTDFNVPTDFFGNSIFLNDWYLGSEYYTLMLDAREGWEPTGIDVSEPGFANVLQNNGNSPGYAFHRMSMDAGESKGDLNFSVAPVSGNDLGTISGFVFNDLNQNGTRQANEGGLQGFTVFLDLDNSGDLSADDVSVITGSTGNYLFENLPADTYDVRIILGPGFDADDQTHPNSVPVGTVGHHLNRILAPGQSLGSGLVDFGFFDPTAVATSPRDHGDLGGAYQTSIASGGPSHGIVPGYFLGTDVSAEADGQPSAGADADTFDDGVSLLSPVVAGSLVRIDVMASTNVLFLQGWIDFNDDGLFDGDGEHLTFLDSSGAPLPFGQQLRLDAGLNQLTFMAPNSVDAATLAARFRYGEGGVAQFNMPNGVAVLGEVEDYSIAATVSTSFIEPLAGDYDGNNVVDQGDYQVWKETFGSQTDFRADGNADGKVSLADFTVWRDNLGAVAQPLQTILSPIVAAASTGNDGREVAPAATVASSGLAAFSVGGGLEEDLGSSLAESTNEAVSTDAVDLAFYQTDDSDDEDSVELLANDSSDAASSEALQLALEEEFSVL